MKATPYMLETMRKIRPWVTFLALSGFVIVAGMLTTAGILTYQAITKGLSDFATAARFTIAGALIINGLMAIHPSLKLWSFGEACGQFVATKSASALEFGLAEHRRFWESWTSLTLVALILNSTVALLLTFVVGK